MTVGTVWWHRGNDCGNAGTREPVCCMRRLALTRSELSLSLSWGFARVMGWMWRCVTARAAGGVPAFPRSRVRVAGVWAGPLLLAEFADTGSAWPFERVRRPIWVERASAALSAPSLAMCGSEVDE